MTLVSAVRNIAGTFFNRQTSNILYEAAVNIWQDTLHCYYCRGNELRFIRMLLITRQFMEINV